MELTDTDRQNGLMIVECKCCGNIYKAHKASNSTQYSMHRNFGCHECKGVIEEPGRPEAITMQPHQQRVVNEKVELDIKRIALNEFSNSEIYKSLNDDEQDRLNRQYAAMSVYSVILTERIDAFKR